MSKLLKIDIPLDRFGQEELSVLTSYESLNPEFSVPRSTRAQLQLAGIFFNEDGSEKPENEVNRARRIFVARIKALVPQLEENSLWNSRKAAVLEKRNGHSKKDPVMVAATEQEFREAPVTAFKTLQKIFTGEAERLPISREQSRELGHDYSELVIDAGRLNAKKLDNLGLGEFTPPKRTRREIQIEYFSKAIPELKEALKDLEAFVIIDPQTGKPQRQHNYQNSRLFRIGAKNRRNNPFAGHILGTQRNNGTENCYIATIHDASRRIDEISVNYYQEIKMMADIKRKMYSIDQLVAKNWALAKTMLPQLKKDLLELIGKLYFVSDEDKVKLKNKITNALDFSTLTTLREKYGIKEDGNRGIVREKQKRRILNPGATRAKWAGFDKDISSRLARIRRIAPYLTDDKLKLEESISNQQSSFNELFKRLTSQPEHFKILNYTLELSPSEINKLVAKMEMVAAKFETDESKDPRAVQYFEPYLSLAERISGHSKKTAEILSKAKTAKERKEAAREFVKIYSMAAAANIYISFQLIHDDLVGNKIPYFNNIRRKISEMKKGELSKPFGPKEIRNNQYSKVLKGMWEFTQVIDKLAADGVKAAVDTDDKKAKKIQEKMKQEMRDKLKIWKNLETADI